MSVSMSEPPDILSPKHDLDPNETYRALLEDHPVLFDAGTNSWLVCRHADLVRIFKSRSITSENYDWQIAPVHGRTIIQMEGKEHTMHRRLLSPFFHGGGLETFKPTIHAAAESLITPILEREAAAVARGEKSRGEVDLAKGFFHQFPITVIEEMLALPAEDHADFERWYSNIMDFIANISGAQEPMDRGLAARAEMSEYFLPLVAKRREGDGHDLLTLMCQAEVDGQHLTDEEVRAFISLMITAGGETTDRALGNMFMQLLRHPDQLKAVYNDRNLIIDAFAETMRHTPPVHIAGRQPTEDIEIAGVTIPKGATITCLVAAAGRDPRKFSDPDRFDIFRTDNDTDRAFSAAADHLGFANGRHFCAGAMLARAEVEIGANLLLDRMSDLRMADGFAPEPHGRFTRGVDSLKVTYVAS